MKLITEINSSNDLKKGDQFIESNYYHLTVLKVGNIVNKGFNTYGRDVEFLVKTKTGRILENEIKCISI